MYILSKLNFIRKRVAAMPTLAVITAAACYGSLLGTKVCRYNWRIAGFLGWSFPFPVLKSEYIFQIKCTEAILSNSTGKLLWFEIIKMLIAVFSKINLLCYL